MSLDELKQAVQILEAVEAELASIAYGGYCGSSQGFVSPPTSKHGMVEAEIEVVNEGMYRELESLKNDSIGLSQQIEGMARKYGNLVWDRAPGESVGEEAWASIERYEKRRKAKRSS